MTTSDQVLQSISTRLESIDDSLNSLVRLQERNNEILERNTDHLGTISEKLTRLENKIDTRFEQVSRSFENLEALIRQMHEVTQAQSGHIDRLMSITETLIQQRVA